MKVNQNLVLLVILIYPLVLGLPFIQDRIGLALNIYYFTIPCLLLFLVLFFLRKKMMLVRKELSSILLLLLLIVQCVTFLGRVAFPIVFFSVIAISIISFYNLHGSLSRRMIYYIVIAYFIFSIIAFLDPGNFALFGRFSGFTISASTYSTFITAIYITFHLNCKVETRIKSIIYLGFLILIGLSETRLNLLLFLLLPIIFWVSNNRKLKLLGLLTFVIALNLVYPIYRMVVKKSDAIASFRYEDGRDASFQLRYALFNDVWEAYKSQPLTKKIFGAGQEAARELIKEAYGEDHMPHQDFVRLLYDFGLLGFFAFLTLVFQLALTNRVSYSLAYLFFLSFFHNMIFNLFIIMLIVFFSANAFRENFEKRRTFVETE